MMNAQKVIGKLPSSAGVTQGAVLLAAKIILLVAVFCLVGQPALAKGPKNCSQAAKSASKACKSEVKDDYYIAVGKCYNLPSQEETKDCIQDAKVEQKEAKELCGDQVDARKDVCEGVGEDPYNPDIGSLTFILPASINAGNANPYFPLVPTYMWTYKTRVGGVVTETITVEVLAGETVNIEGVDCVVVHDIVYEGDLDNPADDPDEIIEDTYDWYGQQDDGTVWYFGEFSLATQECDEETGELCEEFYDDEGSWRAGFDGAKPGIIMFADPSDPLLPGTVFRQEYALGDAEDVGEVINFNEETVVVPAGTFNANVLKSKDYTPIEPDVYEYKYYAPGVGVIKEQAFEDGIETGEVVELESKNF